MNMNEYYFIYPDLLVIYVMSLLTFALYGWDKHLSVYQKTRGAMKPYIQAEKEYIRQKQARAEARNKARKRKRELSG